MQGIVETWLADLHSLLKGEPLTVTEVRIGVFYTAVRVSSEHVGVAFTPRDLTDTVCCPRSAAAAPPAGRMAGEQAWTLAQYAFSSVPLRRAVGVAVLNALSALAIARHGVPSGHLLSGVDALAATQVQPQDRVAMVGAFVPFIKALKDRVEKLWIVDKHQHALKPEELPLWRAPQHATGVLSQASVVIITGSALVEGGLDELLAAAGQARRVVLAGPTASLWPPPFFARGVHILGGIRVHDSAKLLQVVSEGGSGYVFQTVAEKVCVVRDGE
ncbi:MAG: DUF364 domain-containing protein [Candidatus Binatia bacterium]|nr:DUF364 domain-containing protein [Candidatus Binatia bacterium]